MTIHYDPSFSSILSREEVIQSACGIRMFIGQDSMLYRTNFAWFLGDITCKDCLATEVYQNHLSYLEIGLEGDMYKFEQWKHQQDYEERKQNK